MQPTDPSLPSHGSQVQPRQPTHRVVLEVHSDAPLCVLAGPWTLAHNNLGYSVDVLRVEAYDPAGWAAKVEAERKAQQAGRQALATAVAKRAQGQGGPASRAAGPDAAPLGGGAP